MEPASGVSGVQPETWAKYLKPTLDPLRGQDLLWTCALVDMQNAELAVLPTGYGKTLAALGYYGILRERGMVNRVLWLVPTDALRDQLVPRLDGQDLFNQRRTVAQEGAQTLGLGLTEAVVAEKVSRTFRYHRENKAEIFIATYQQVANEDGFFRELLEDAEGYWRWLIVCDEAHHLALDAKWGPAVHRLPFARILYLSATPMRSDRKLLQGVPLKQTQDGEWTYDAAVEISYVEALREQAIRQPVGHIQHYFVDAETRDGDHVRITTELLQREDVTDLSSYEAKRGLRYCKNYLSTIINDALLCLEEKLIRQPTQHQMLVFAMSCDHAAAVAGHFNELESGSADWIGITRSDHLNKAVLKRFTDNKLKVLVQVDKAGEGFDNKRCSILVFLHLIHSETKLFQQLGRGLRRNRTLRFEEDVADVFASADTPIAAQIRELEAQWRTYKVIDDDTDGGSDGPGGDIFDLRIPDLLIYNAEWYRTDHVSPRSRPVTPPEWMTRAAQETGVPVEKLVEAFAYMPRGGNGASGGPGTPSEATLLAYYQEQVKHATSKVAYYIVRSICGRDAFRSDWTGTVKKRINERWAVRCGKHKDMVAEDFRRKHQWLKELALEIKEMGIPGWLKPDA